MRADLSGAAMRYAETETRRTFEEVHVRSKDRLNKGQPVSYIRTTPSDMMVALDSAFKAGAKWAYG